MPPKAKKSSSKTDEAEDLIIDYLKKVNRPYSASDVSSNLHNQVSKVNAQKILISLAESGVVRGKQYGKQWVFCINQDNIDVPSVEEAEEVEEQIKELSEEVAALKSENGAMQAKLNALNSSLTNEQITKRIEELKDKNAANTAKLQVLRSGEVISEEEKQRIVNYHEEMVKLYKKRKRMFKDAFDMISENYPGKPHELMAKIGAETDEDAGFDINAPGFGKA